MPNRENSKEDRLNEAEKQMAEAERSKAVAFVKMWHREIEKIEKSRKSPEVLSLQFRITTHIETISLVMKGITSRIGKSSIGATLIQLERQSVQNLIETYKSIREDFKDIGGIDNEKLKSLFPERNIYFETREQALNVLLGICEQELQISVYLFRKI